MQQALVIDALAPARTTGQQIDGPGDQPQRGSVTRTVRTHRALRSAPIVQMRSMTMPASTDAAESQVPDHSAHIRRGRELGHDAAEFAYGRVARTVHLDEINGRDRGHQQRASSHNGTLRSATLVRVGQESGFPVRLRDENGHSIG